MNLKNATLIGREEDSYLVPQLFAIQFGEPENFLNWSPSIEKAITHLATCDADEDEDRSTYGIL
jgi:hypothetical protein